MNSTKLSLHVDVPRAKGETAEDRIRNLNIGLYNRFSDGRFTKLEQKISKEKNEHRIRGMRVYPTDMNTDKLYDELASLLLFPVDGVPVIPKTKFGPGYIFEKKENQHVGDFLALVDSPELTNTIHDVLGIIKLDNRIVNLNNNGDGFIEEPVVKFAIAYYEPGDGVTPHIDNIRRSTGGPIYTLSVSKKDVMYYDMLHVDSGKVYRVKIPEKTIVCMGGLSRYAYAHSIPYGDDYGGDIKFTLIFMVDLPATNRITGFVKKTKCAIRE